MTQQIMSFWVFIQRKRNHKSQKDTCTPHIQGSTIYNTQDMEAT